MKKTTQTTTKTAKPEYGEKLEFKMGDKIYGRTGVYKEAAEDVAQSLGLDPLDTNVINQLTVNTFYNSVVNPNANPVTKEDDALMNFYRGNSQQISHYANKPKKRESEATRAMKVTIEAAPVLNYRIHFMLDNIDSTQAVDKKYDSVTFAHKELRYIFRNWEALKSHVKFYRNTKDGIREVKAPWDDPSDSKAQQAWAEYKIKLSSQQ